MLKKIFILTFFTIISVVIVKYVIAETTEPITDNTDQQQKSSIEKGMLMKKIQERGTLIIGLEPEYFPFEFKYRSKVIEGFDVDIANEIAKELGVQLKIKEYKWEELIPALTNNEIDMIISGMTRTKERAEKIDFIKPYFTTGQVVVLSKKAKKISSVTDLNKYDIKIGVQKGTTGEIVVKNMFPEASHKKYYSVYDCQKELLNGKLDAIVYDKPLADEFVRLFPDKIYIPFSKLTTEDYCIALNKNNKDSIKWLDNFIETFLNSNKYKTLYKKWFKTE